AQLQGLGAQKPALEQARAQSRHAIALLLAQPPGAIDARLSAGARATTPLPRIDAGLPSDLLRRRPDIRRSEAQLHAATARQGVAEARLFPSVTLGLAAGFQAARFAQLDDWGSRFALGGVDVSIPIFQGGQLRAQVTLAGLDAQRAALEFRKTVLGAFHDADLALSAYGRAQQRGDALRLQLASAQRARELSQHRWQDGLTAYVEVLDAERRAREAEQQLAQSETDAGIAWVSLCKALGGGWTAADGEAYPPVAAGVAASSPKP
ncbi:MAG: TolC family protein, partial [Stenotrophomonas sp.]|nr:TolC family protein [Stenotrophomonas sp.]